MAESKKIKLSKKELFYESIATDFDNVMSRYEVGKRLDIIFNNLLKDISGKTFLDAGCGTGLFSKAAVDRGAKVTSLEVGPKLLKEVAKKCNSKRVVGSATNLPFKDNSFDIVIATEIVEHTEDPIKAIKELSRVTKPGGTLVITLPNKLWKFSLYIADWLNIRPYHANENWQTWWWMQKEIAKNGMKIQNKLGFNILPYYHPILQPFITKADTLGKDWGFLMVNMAFVAKKSA